MDQCGCCGFEKYFDGSEKPASNRIANAQKSIRTNDIENVGRTARHHTFFEMLETSQLEIISKMRQFSLHGNF